MGDAWFRQEYMCEFIEEGHQMFGRDLVMGALDDEEPLFCGTGLGAETGFQRGGGGGTR
jgi:hypothetical protein